MQKYRYIANIITFILLTAVTANAGVEVFAPRLSISEEYTDNLFLANTQTQEEFITIISPGLDYSATRQNGGTDVSYTAGYATYHKSDEVSFLRHNATVSMWADFAKHTRAEFNDFFLWTNEPYQRTDYSLLGYIDFEGQLLPVLDTTIRTGLNEYITNTAVADLIHQFGGDNSFTMSALFSLRKEIDSEFNNDNKQYAPSIDLTYWITPKLGLDISAVYTRGVYEYSEDFDDWSGLATLRRTVSRHFEIFAGYDHTLRRYTEDTAIDYDSYSGNAGFTYRTSENISITLGVGYFLQDFKDDTDEDGLFFSGSVDKSWATPRSTARIIGSAGLDRNEFGTENLGLERFYGLGASAIYQFTRVFSGNFNATARVSEYLNTENDQTDYQANAGIGFTYTHKTWFSINTAYRHNLLRGRGDGNYNENTATLTVSFTPQGFRYQ